LSAREEGPFSSFVDFLSRVDARRVNKKVLESLIKVGAFSKFGNRATLLSSLDTIREKVTRPKALTNQQGLFSQEEIKKSAGTNMTKNMMEMEEFSDEEIQALERQLLGFSLSAKPLSEIIGTLGNMATHKVEDVLQNGVEAEVKVAIVVDEMRVVVTRKTGREMAFVRVKDETGSCNLVVFPSIYQDTQKFWVDNKPLLITGRIDHRDDETSLIVNNVDSRDSLRQNNENLFIKIPKSATKENLASLKKLLLANPGNKAVTLVFGRNSNKKVKLKIKISWNEDMAKKISQALNDNS
jgi:DNA polymerase-3 subunit alpha